MAWGYGLSALCSGNDDAREGSGGSNGSNGSDAAVLSVWCCGQMQRGCWSSCTAAVCLRGCQRLRRRYGMGWTLLLQGRHFPWCTDSACGLRTGGGSRRWAVVCRIAMVECFCRERLCSSRGGLVAALKGRSGGNWCLQLPCFCGWGVACLQQDVGILLIGFIQRLVWFVSVDSGLQGPMSADYSR